MRLTVLLENQVSGFYSFALPMELTLDDNESYSGEMIINIGFSNTAEEKILKFILGKSKTFLDWLNEYLASGFGSGYLEFEASSIQRNDLVIISSDFHFKIDKITPQKKTSISPNNLNLDELKINAEFENISDFFSTMSNSPKTQKLLQKHFPKLEDYIELPW